MCMKSCVTACIGTNSSKSQIKDHGKVNGNEEYTTNNNVTNIILQITLNYS